MSNNVHLSILSVSFFVAFIILVSIKLVTQFWAVILLISDTKLKKVIPTPIPSKIMTLTLTTDYCNVKFSLFCFFLPDSSKNGDSFLRIPALGFHNLYFLYPYFDNWYPLIYSWIAIRSYE